MMTTVRTVFARDKAVVGMVHVAALPGTPHHEWTLGEIKMRAVTEARQLVGSGCDGVILENMHDRPYLLREVGPEVVAAMAAVTAAVRREIEVPLGVQILAGANCAALAVAHAAGAQFIRAEGFVFAHVADEGLMAGADAGPLMRYRRQIGAEHVAIFADVKKKHASHAITADVDLAETARAAEFFGADGVVVTGVATGRETAVEDVRSVAEATALPVAIGSGLTADNLERYWVHANVFVVGSFIKRDGLWSNPIDPERMRRFMDTARRLGAERQ